MADVFINLFLISMLALIAVYIIRVQSLLAAIILSGAYSLTMAVLYVVLDAVDVAFTEAAVGAGVSTILALASLVLLPRQEKPQSLKIIPAFIASIAGLLLLSAIFTLPRFGDASAPVHTHVVPDYIYGSATEIDVPNIVTSILASYRGFDTFGETIVVFTAAIAALLILAGRTRTRRNEVPRPDNNGGDANA